MGFGIICPRCNSRISSERIVGDSVVCECGWCDDTFHRNSERQVEKNTVRIFLYFLVGFSILSAQLLYWGSWAFRMPILQIGSATGLNSPAEINEKIEACIALNKWDCAKDAHYELYHKTRDAEAFFRLAKLQTALKETKLAAGSYQTYFKIGGKSPDAAFFFAKILENSGQNDSAIHYYQMAADGRPDVLPVTATSSIVRLLMTEKRFAEARDVILQFHASAGNAKEHLNTELGLIEKEIGPAKPKKLARR